MTSVLPKLIEMTKYAPIPSRVPCCAEIHPRSKSVAPPAKNLILDTYLE
jgi:hypothetical protein